MAKEIKLSATRINSFLQCIQRYWFQYVDHLPKVSPPAFKLGTAVHESLDLAGQIWMEKEKFSKADKKKILDEYVRVSIKEGINDLAIHKEGLELLTNKLNNFDIGKILSLEKTFGYGKEGSLDIKTRDGIKLIGAIDKAIEINEDTLLIIDYKTSKMTPTPDQLRTDPQLSIYDLAATFIWPNYKRIILSLDMLKDQMVYTYRTPDERIEFSEYLKAMHTQMVNLERKDAKARLNIFCPWCDFKEYCDEYKSACKKSDYKFLSTARLDDDTLLTEWNSVRSTKKILDNRERELNMYIMDKIRENHENLVMHNDDQNLEIYIRQNSRTTYDLDTVYKAMPIAAFLKVVNLNKGAVERYISSNPAVKDRIYNSARVNYTAPFLSTKKKKKEK